MQSIELSKFQNYKNDFLSDKRIYSSSGTIIVYKQILNKLSSFENIKKDFENKFKDLGNKTKNQNKDIINNFINYCNKNYSLNLPILDFKFKVQKKQKEALSVDEVSKIKKFIETKSTIQERIAILLLLETGIRIEEYNNFVIKINHKNIFSFIELNTKGNFLRQIKVSEYLRNLILECGIENIKWLETTGARKNRISKIGNLLEFDRSLSAHLFRHTAITKFYKMTKNLVLTSKFAGHQNTETTLNYITNDLNELSDAIQIVNEYDIQNYDEVKLKELVFELLKDRQNLKEIIEAQNEELKIFKNGGINGKEYTNSQNQNFEVN